MHVITYIQHLGFTRSYRVLSGCWNIICNLIIQNTNLDLGSSAGCNKYIIGWLYFIFYVFRSLLIFHNIRYWNLASLTVVVAAESADSVSVVGLTS